MTLAFVAPLRDRLPWLRDRWQTIRLTEPPHDVRWVVGPATDFDVLGEILVLGEYDDLGLSSPRVIFDLGSHIGVSILRLRARYPTARIYGFEPDPRTFARLVRNMAQLQGVKVLPWAVGGVDHRAAFYSRRQSWTSSVVPDGSSPATTVECVTLDTALERLGETELDLVKIDVEGAEALVLAGFRSLAKVRMIVGELHGDDVRKQVLDVLGDFDVEFRGHPDHCHFRARRRAGSTGSSKSPAQSLGP